ncbi:MAG: hypothetical protein ACYCT9_11595 [Leptospirillum sp.]
MSTTISWPTKHNGENGGPLNQIDIARSIRSHGGETDLPRKTVREAS